MTKRWTCLGLAVCLLVVAGAALAAPYSFPHAGIRLEVADDWTLLTPDTLDEQSKTLAALGADPEVLRADYAANHTVFEIFMPDGIQVSLSAARTEQTTAWDSIARMSEADKDALLEAYSIMPYEGVVWAESLPGYLRYTSVLNAGGIPVGFAGLVTVRQGMLYTLTASSASADAEALHQANALVSANLFFQGVGTAAAQQETVAVVPPEAVADDDRATPIAIDPYESVSYEDTTTLYIQTLPGAEVLLRTQTDMLRGRADEAGKHQFRVSTKRETIYTYEVSAVAEGRTESTIEVSISRQLSPEAQEAAYRRSARQISYYGYTNLVGAPEAYSGQPITFRGRVGAFSELGGFPCALIYTENPGKGVWRTPVWVMLTDATALEIEDIRTFYGDLRGDTLPYEDENGETQQAPVVISRAVAP